MFSYNSWEPLGTPFTTSRSKDLISTHPKSIQHIKMLTLHHVLIMILGSFASSYFQVSLPAICHLWPHPFFPSWTSSQKSSVTCQRGHRDRTPGPLDLGVVPISPEFRCWTVDELLMNCWLEELSKIALFQASNFGQALHGSTTRSFHMCSWVYGLEDAVATRLSGIPSDGSSKVASPEIHESPQGVMSWQIWQWTWDHNGSDYGPLLICFNSACIYSSVIYVLILFKDLHLTRHTCPTCQIQAVSVLLDPSHHDLSVLEWAKKPANLDLLRPWRCLWEQGSTPTSPPLRLPLCFQSELDEWKPKFSKLSIFGGAAHIFPYFPTFHGCLPTQL